MTTTDKYLLLFAKDVQNGTAPKVLIDQVQKIKIEAHASGKPLKMILKINSLRSIFRPKEKHLIADFYKTKNEVEQTKIF